MVGELEMWTQPPSDKDRRSKACAQRDYHLDALPLHHREPLNVSIVLDAYRLAQLTLERAPEVEAMKSLRTQIRCGADHPVADDSRETNRDAIEARQPRHELADDRNELLRREVLGSIHLHSVVQHLAARVEHRRFDVRSTDIDRERLGFCAAEASLRTVPRQEVEGRSLFLRWLFR